MIIHKRISDFKNVIEERKNSKMSVGEKVVSEFLDDKDIRYIREYYTKGLVNPKTGCPLFIDFYLPVFKIAIEVDGRHHFECVKTTERLHEQLYRDEIKNKFCASNNIRLIRLLYKDLKNGIPTLVSVINGIKSGQIKKHNKTYNDLKQLKRPCKPPTAAKIAETKHAERIAKIKERNNEEKAAIEKYRNHVRKFY